LRIKITAKLLKIAISAGRKRDYSAVGERFWFKSRYKTEGILCVFRGLVLQSWAKRSGDPPISSFEDSARKKGSGAHTAPHGLPFHLIQVLLSPMLIRRTEPCGLWRDGEPEPCGRWQWPFSGGSHGLWICDDGWADRYASFGTPPVIKVMGFHLCSTAKIGRSKTILHPIQGHSVAL
jgi:hypothetical protein